MKSENTTIRISDIARMAGVSAGTVDRVLHNRGRVSDEKRAKVEAVLREINYRPNPLARTLANSRRYRFVALIPEYRAGEYWEQVALGIRRAGEALNGFGIDVEIVCFDQYDRGSFRNLLQPIITQAPDALVIATLFEAETIAICSRLDKLQIPYVFIDSNLKGCNNLSYFGVDSYQSGKVGAALMLRDQSSCYPVLSVLYETADGELSLQSRLRRTGFVDALREWGHTGIHQTILLHPHRPEENRKQLRDAIDTIGACGLIVFNSRVHEVIGHYLPEKAVVRIIGYDLIAANRKALIEGKISFLIGQRADIQGYDAVKALSNHLLLDEKIEKQYFMPIDILIRENIAYHNNYNL